MSRVISKTDAEDFWWSIVKTEGFLLLNFCWFYYNGFDIPNFPWLNLTINW